MANIEVQSLGRCHPLLEKITGGSSLSPREISTILDMLPMQLQAGIAHVIAPGEEAPPLPKGSILHITATFAHSANQHIAIFHWRKGNTIFARTNCLAQLVAEKLIRPGCSYAKLVRACRRKGWEVMDIKFVGEAGE